MISKKEIIELIYTGIDALIHNNDKSNNLTYTIKLRSNHYNLSNITSVNDLCDSINAYCDNKYYLVYGTKLVANNTIQCFIDIPKAI